MYKYTIELLSDIINEGDFVVLKHSFYGINIWMKETEDRNDILFCIITKEEIPVGTIMYKPMNFVPYQDERVSIKGMEILIKRMKRKTGIK